MMALPSRAIVKHDLFRCLTCQIVSHYVDSVPEEHIEPLPAPSGQAAVDPATGEAVTIKWTTYTCRCIKCGSQDLEKVARAALPFQKHLQDFESSLYKITHPTERKA